MKKLLFINLAIICTLCFSCKSRSQSRTLDDIFRDVVSAYTDTTDSERFFVLLDEYADSLYSDIVNSPINNTGQRVMAQKRAGNAISLCLSHLDDPSPLVPGLIKKFNDAIMTWRIVPGDSERPGCSYMKEIFYVANKETDHESEEVMSFVVRTGEAPMSLVIIPEGDENAKLSAEFFNRASEGDAQFIDFETGVHLDLDFLSDDYGERCYIIPGSEFFNQMMSHDYLFIMYTTGEEEQYESVMVTLDTFHEQVSESLDGRGE